MIRSALSAVCAGVVVVALVGCEGLSDGNRPESIEVTSPSGGVAYRCFTSAIGATATFTDGVVSDFSSRVVWSSSDPGVVEVSNGDIEIGSSGSFYSIGTLIARSNGVATIQADLAGLVDSAQVEVKSVADLYVEGESPVVATGSNIQLEAQLVVEPDDAPVDVTDTVVWSIPAPDGSLDVASGVVTALAPGAAQLVRAGFETCEDGADFLVQAADATALRIERELAEDATLAVGTTERYTIYAQFEGSVHPEQNVSNDVDVVLLESDEDAAGLSQGDEHWYLLALDESDGQGIEVRFDAPDLTAESVRRPQVEREFDVLVLSPAEASLSWDDELQLTAIATDSEAGISQVVTRHVNWSVDVVDVLTVDSSLDDAGLVTPNGQQDGEVQIVGTLENTTERVDDVVTLRITVPQ